MVRVARSAYAPTPMPTVGPYALPVPRRVPEGGRARNLRVGLGRGGFLPGTGTSLCPYTSAYLRALRITRLRRYG